MVLVIAARLGVVGIAVLFGIFGALKVLKLSPASDELIGYGSTVAFSLVIFCPILLWAVFDPQKRCLHDIFAGVVVVNRP